MTALRLNPKRNPMRRLRRILRRPEERIARPLDGETQAERSQETDTMSIAQRQPEKTPPSVHVVPLDIEDERLLALLDRYVDAVNAGDHPPIWYVNHVVSEISAIRAGRCEEGGAWWV
jgi:hypothetical protein